MKKIWTFILGLFIILVLVSLVFFDFNKKDNSKNLEKVTLAEVAHTVFYAPQYVAIEKGFF